MAGTAAGQILAAAASPLLSRLYTPDDFGTFSIVSAIAVTLGTIATFRYELAVPLPEDDEDGKALLLVGAVCCVATGAVFTAGFWLWESELASLFGHAELEKWLIAAPIIAALLGLFRLLNQWALRRQHYNATARRNVLQAIITTVAQLVAGWRGFGAGGLVGGLGVGQAAGTVSMLRGAGLRDGPRTSTRQLWAVARRYKKFPLLLTLSGLVMVAGVYAPLLLIAAFYGPAAAGWLGFTQRILGLPMTLIGQSVAQVYLSQLAQARRDATGRELALFWAATKRLALLGLLGALVLVVAGEPIFAFVFGDQWRVSGYIAQALGLSLAAQLIASPLSQTLIVFERNGLQLIWDITRFAGTAGVVIGCYLTGGGLLACVWAFSITSTVAYLVSWEMARRTVSASVSES